MVNDTDWHQLRKFVTVLAVVSGTLFVAVQAASVVREGSLLPALRIPMLLVLVGAAYVGVTQLEARKFGLAALALGAFVAIDLVATYVLILQEQPLLFFLLLEFIPAVVLIYLGVWVGRRVGWWA